MARERLKIIKQKSTNMIKKRKSIEVILKLLYQKKVTVEEALDLLCGEEGGVTTQGDGTENPPPPPKPPGGN